MLRPASHADLDRMRTWRNHPEVRSVSLTQHIIEEPEHRQWWEAVEGDDTRLVLIQERQATPSGVVAFFDIDREAGTAWWSYFLDNEGLDASGQLFPAWISIQREAVKYARDVLKLRELHAETLTSNLAAADFNKRQGFREVERYPRDIDGHPATVVHTVLKFEENS